MLDLAQLQLLIHAALKLLPKGIHLILLFLKQVLLCVQDLLVAVLHVFLAFALLDLVGALLDLMSLLIVLLLGQVGLDLAQIQQLRGELKGEGQVVLQVETVLLEGLSVELLKFLKLALIFLLFLL